MDPLDSFYQQLDSDQLLKRHGPELLTEAREVLANNPELRIAGLITQPDSSDAEGVRKMLAATAGKQVPAGIPLVGVVLRDAVEHLLESRCGNVSWREEPWQQQLVFPVVVSTKDGFRFGFFGLGTPPTT